MSRSRIASGRSNRGGRATGDREGRERRRPIRTDGGRDERTETDSATRERRGTDRLTRAAARGILDVSVTATDGEIRAAYRERVREVHPDRGGDEATFKRVIAAYERLHEQTEGRHSP